MKIDQEKLAQELVIVRREAPTSEFLGLTPEEQRLAILGCERYTLEGLIGRLLMLADGGMLEEMIDIGGEQS